LIFEPFQIYAIAVTPAMISSLQPKRPKASSNAQQSRQIKVTKIVDGRASSMPQQQIRHESDKKNVKKEGGVCVGAVPEGDALGQRKQRAKKPER
jgi:hypothetical protein